jgi:cytochrome oxidase Cu insertion factor (SCO1/SenC/PrrC family)
MEYERRTNPYMLIAVVILIVLLGVGAIAVLGGWFFFSSPEPGEVRNANLQVGDEAPDFRLADHTGGYVRLSDFRGESNVVIAFYPLAWTPV